MIRKAKNTAIDWIDQHRNRIIEVSDEVWSTPELGLLEFKSAKRMIDELKNMDSR